MTHPDDIGHERAEQRQQAAEDGVMLFEDEDWDDGEERACWQCGGEGWGIADYDWPCVEYGWDMPGDIQTCPCCGGSGEAKDGTYW